jgi:hypothetical protein
MVNLLSAFITKEFSPTVSMLSSSNPTPFSLQ